MNFSILVITRNNELKNLMLNEFIMHRFVFRKRIYPLLLKLNNFQLLLIDFTECFGKELFHDIAANLVKLHRIPTKIFMFDKFPGNKTIQIDYTCSIIPSSEPVDLIREIKKFSPLKFIRYQYRLKNIIDKKPHIPISKIAKFYNLNYRKASMIFKEEFGCTPFDYSQAILKNRTDLEINESDFNYSPST